MAQYIGAETLGFLSVEGLRAALNDSQGERFCYGCFSGDYIEDICRQISVEPTDKSHGPGLKNY